MTEFSKKKKKKKKKKKEEEKKATVTLILSPRPWKSNSLEILSYPTFAWDGIKIHQYM